MRGRSYIRVSMVKKSISGTKEQKVAIIGGGLIGSNLVDGLANADCYNHY